MKYLRTEHVRHPESLVERLITDEVLEGSELAFEVVEDKEWVKENHATWERDGSGAVRFLQFSFPWPRDFTQTVIIRYEQIGGGA